MRRRLGSYGHFHFFRFRSRFCYPGVLRLYYYCLSYPCFGYPLVQWLYYFPYRAGSKS